MSAPTSPRRLDSRAAAAASPTHRPESNAATSPNGRPASKMAAPSTDQHRPRSRMLSFRSHRSSSSGSVTKADLSETAKEKANRRMTTKADPTLAINEAQPAAQAQAATTLQPLRSLEHRDSYGQVISDPDRSNPTRARMERPLDTIRSFEAAVETTYNRRNSSRGFGDFQLGPAPGTPAPDMQSRRSSWMPATGHFPPSRVRGAPGGEPFGHRPARPDSLYSTAGRPHPPPHHHPGHPHARGAGAFRPGPPPPSGPPRPMRRGGSDPLLYGGGGAAAAAVGGGYPPAAVGPGAAAMAAYDAATTGSGSGSASQGTGTEPWANSTGPSSENSSVNAANAAAPSAAHAAHAANGKPPPPPPHMARQPAPEPDLADVYGLGSFGAGPQPAMDLSPLAARALAPAHPRTAYAPQANGAMGPPPPPPAHRQTSGPGAALAPGSVGPPPQPQQPRPRLQKPHEPAQKRKSWLKRAFGK